MKVINLLAGPGTGKSTTASGLFYQLKSRHLNVELVSEYAKILAWEKNHNLITDQLYITAKQNRGLERLRDQVEFAITDSPLPLALYYGRDYRLQTFDAMVSELFDSYDNVNYFIRRKKTYNPAGRFQTEMEAIAADSAIKALFKKKGWEFTEVDGDEHVVESILHDLNLRGLVKKQLSVKTSISVSCGVG
jgi:hypothetical protein